MSNLPKHIAIIMDGNGRWAQRRNLPRIAGHKMGGRVARHIIKACAKRNINVLTLFAFSTENWGRPRSEVAFLMDFFKQSIQDEAQALHEANVQLHVIGNRHSLSRGLVEKIEKIESMTSSNDGLKLVVAIDYSGRWDFTQAARSIARRVKQGALDPSEIDENCIKQALCLHQFPEPDLFIRTSGEKRISNFMLWQMAYTELFFTDLFWPEFTEESLDEALAFFASRRRRFGLLTESPVG